MFGELLFTFFTILFSEFKELMPLVILFVPALIMMQSGLPVFHASYTFSEDQSGKHLTVT